MGIEGPRPGKLGPQLLTDAARAAIELGWAWLWLDSRSAKAMIAPPGDDQPLDGRQSALVDRIAFIIPRVAARLPWRGDCLVQALAAQHWLRRHGIAARLVFGVPKSRGANFEAHAWLMAGDRVVTGGDISGYEPLARP